MVIFFFCSSVSTFTSARKQLVAAGNQNISSVQLVYLELWLQSKENSIDGILLVYR